MVMQKTKKMKRKKMSQSGQEQTLMPMKESSLLFPLRMVENIRIKKVIPKTSSLIHWKCVSSPLMILSRGLRFYCLISIVFSFSSSPPSF